MAVWGWFFVIQFLSFQGRHTELIVIYPDIYIYIVCIYMYIYIYVYTRLQYIYIYNTTVNIVNSIYTHESTWWLLHGANYHLLLYIERVNYEFDVFSDSNGCQLHPKDKGPWLYFQKPIAPLQHSSIYGSSMTVHPYWRFQLSWSRNKHGFWTSQVRGWT